MKKGYIFYLMLIALVGFNSLAVAADFKDGLAAYNSGDYVRAYETFLPLAEAGNAKAQHLLGHMYIEGNGVEKDTKQGLQWFRKAAQQGVKIEEDYGEITN